ncbi:hypothetical protein [Herbaspirillum rubrisubalbicans]|uniref:Major tropism determinant N-terminal domain-containing protein n=1 Tax=Herbaspirillum rubrisubalbicans TaxID=80842 RepID=A0AAD0U8F1_9BURK|nr:hypothetical protein [Herbaspirillum rubrisubalbicans]AYR23035.1 hypothetical protein RC54_04015 [Herbaspirillum rubrisubalbicans]
MSTVLQLRRGTTAQHASFVGQPGEVTFDTTKKVFVGHDGVTPGGFPMARQASSAIGTSGHSGLIGANDATTPNSKFTVSSITATYRNAEGGTLTLYTGSTQTVDISQAGPVANGRDQSGTFGASAKVNLYKIYNGTTEALIASLAGPSVGPALPSGYTYWAYAGSVVLDGSANMRRMYMASSRMIFQSPPLVLSANPTLAVQSVSHAAYVPTLALDVVLNCYGSVTMPTAGEASNVIQLASGITFDRATSITENAGTGYAGYGRTVIVPNLPSQAVFSGWAYPVTVPTAVASNIAVQSFTVPNGAI